MEPATALRWGGFASGLGMVAGIGWWTITGRFRRLRLAVHVLAAAAGGHRMASVAGCPSWCWHSVRRSP
jgi:hypothetical protein